MISDARRRELASQAEAELRRRLRLVTRAYEMCRAKRLPALWIEGALIWFLDGFGDREFVSWERLQQMVEAAEAPRKDAAREQDLTDVRKEAG